MRPTSELVKLDPSRLILSELMRVARRKFWTKNPLSKRKGEGDGIENMSRYGLLKYIVGDHPDYL